MIAARAGFTRLTCALLGGFVTLAACSSRPKPTSDDAGTDGPPWSVGTAEPAPRPGMVWIPPGSLVAGTPVGKSPRVPDEEMAGEQLIMQGFYIDVYLFPNEQGALPKTFVTHAEAADACAQQNKRLCTELELERACKGPQNTAYEYGDVYKSNVCNMGVVRAPGPNGMNPMCASGFGVHDLHGSAWTWTASAWKRDPAKSGLVGLRGGNGPIGELFGRCANGRGLRPEVSAADIGFRCCAGEPNTAAVSISVPRGDPLSLKPPDGKISKALETLARSHPDAPKTGQFVVERMWIWRPFGNEELWVGGGCSEIIKSKKGKKRRAGCGILIGREGAEAPVALTFVQTDRYQPTLSTGATAREVYLYGGDENGPFRRLITYDWGKINVGEKARRREGKGDVYE
ncbi:MAG: SUMF1/EgtB/PvdO family nonheme iron enzyme [Polyangiaceae bacterium]|nr:SUMF1/EgtB/PvdO family nonheme iron enzyme [Polyangiaceae bacterium]